MGWRIDHADLWRRVDAALNRRLPDSVLLTKVKGHATGIQVEQGVATAKGKHGNDKAGETATAGIFGGGADTIHLTYWVKSRYEAYTSLIVAIYRHIAAVIEADLEKRGLSPGTLREDLQKTNKKIKPPSQALRRNSTLPNKSQCRTL